MSNRVVTETDNTETDNTGTDNTGAESTAPQPSAPEQDTTVDATAAEAQTVEADTVKPDAVTAGAATPDAVTPDSGPTVVMTKGGAGKQRGQVTLSTKSLVVSALVIFQTLLLIAATAVMIVFIVRDTSARNELGDMKSAAADSAKAQEVAGTYAVAAATLDYQDLTPWIAAMKKGVSPELQRKYDVVGQTMEQIITPLRMKTTAELVLAKTTEHAGDMYKVDAVVNVTTSTVQNPAGGTAVAVYTITLDRSQNWLITQVGDPTQSIAGNLGSAAAGGGQQGQQAQPGAAQPSAGATPTPTTPALPAPTPAPGG
ncbi:hypothetical protein ABLE92_09660 [Gordonia sp. VNQ95]|uniref:hypothetical protein n=1 Tax=Gordonia sp. VNQ95 TaxID=3156619 RepID=UPI0032B4C3A3